MVEKVTDSLMVLVIDDGAKPLTENYQRPVSFFSMDTNPDVPEAPLSAENDEIDPYAHLPKIAVPKLLQSPSVVPTLFSFSRTAVYILLASESIQEIPTSVVLCATSEHGLLELEIPVDIISEPCATIHQLAARKAI